MGGTNEDDTIRFGEVHFINSIHFCVTQLKGYRKYQMIHGSISRKKLVDL